VPQVPESDQGAGSRGCRSVVAAAAVVVRLRRMLLGNFVMALPPCPEIYD
jgi:hypothetical protein